MKLFLSQTNKKHDICVWIYGYIWSIIYHLKHHHFVIKKFLFFCIFLYLKNKFMNFCIFFHSSLSLTFETNKTKQRIYSFKTKNKHWINRILPWLLFPYWIFSFIHLQYVLSFLTFILLYSDVLDVYFFLSFLCIKINIFGTMKKKWKPCLFFCYQSNDDDGFWFSCCVIFSINWLSMLLIFLN